VLGADLARTGSDTSGARTGALLVAGGVLLVLVGRRRRRQA
jgi:LPXTG-motif cell wall-anchored protein